MRPSLLVAMAIGCTAALLPSIAPNASARDPAAPFGVTWMNGFAAPGTPAKYDKVGVIKVGPRSAKNVLVLEPGTSAGSAYFVPLANWIVSKTSGWQVWSVERRENLLEDQSELNLAKEGKATATQLYDYYLGFIKDPSITHHFQSIPTSSVEFAKQWGMNVAVQDLHIVIGAAKRLGGKVVLGGHSLGGSVVTAYATWDFNGEAGADALAGLVYIDGGSARARSASSRPPRRCRPSTCRASPPGWLSEGSPHHMPDCSTPSGSLAALLFPNQPSLGQSSGLLPSDIVPAARVTNLGQYGYALNASTSPPSLLAAQAHLGQGLTASGPIRGWNGTGALTPIKRFATMFSGYPMKSVDGTEWYFPQRLTDDTGAVDNGNANPAQACLASTPPWVTRLPKNLLIYAFGARLGGAGVLADATLLANQSGIPQGNLTLVNRQSSYSHNDPAGAYPNNVFFAHLVPFLAKISAHARRTLVHFREWSHRLEQFRDVRRQASAPRRHVARTDF